MPAAKSQADRQVRRHEHNIIRPSCKKKYMEPDRKQVYARMVTQYIYTVHNNEMYVCMYMYVCIYIYI